MADWAWGVIHARVYSQGRRKCKPLVLGEVGGKHF